VGNGFLLPTIPLFLSPKTATYKFSFQLVGNGFLLPTIPLFLSPKTATYKFSFQL